jgi:hypothetical protein
MANTYSIETLLEGKYYRSRSYARKGLDGIIQWAEKRENVWYGNNAEAYVVKVRPTYDGKGIFRNDFYATVVVEVGNN